MTAQPAQPTPGPPWPQLTALGDRIYGETPEDGIVGCAYGDPELASIFAAAPELLAALEAFTEAMDMHLGHKHEVAICDADDQARAVIIKARK